MNLLSKIAFALTKKPRNSAGELLSVAVNSINEDILQYQNYHISMYDKSKNEVTLKALVTIRLLSHEIWESVFNSYQEPCDYKYRISAIGKLYNRALTATDENINLIGTGYGISPTSNIRLIIECIALSKYIWIENENEADRFQDFSLIQSKKFNPKIDISEILKKYDEKFEQDFGWMTKPEYKSIPQLLRYLGHDDYISLYKLSSYFVHASSYTNEKLVQNSKSENLGLFPLEKYKVIELNLILLNHFGKLIIEYFLTDNKDSYRKLLDLICTDITTSSS